MSDPQTSAVIDFETTGMSPSMGARATEIAVVLVQGGRAVDRYASLMRSGTWVPPFIEQLTGISNRMLAAAPPAAEVMAEVADFCRGAALVAHNASFDRGFWQHEMALARAVGRLGDADAGGDEPEFGCTLLLSRRIWPEVPNHKLGTLARWHGIAATGRAHRALADAEMAAELWLRITDDVQKRYAASVPFRRAPNWLRLAPQFCDWRALVAATGLYGGGPAAGTTECVIAYFDQLGVPRLS